MALLAKERRMPERTGNPEIGARIRERRLWKGLTQEKLAALMVPAVDQATISNWETAVVDVSTDDVIQLIELLETTTEYLYGKTTEPLNVSARLRRIGLDEGNVKSLNNERIEALIADLAEIMRARRFTPPPEDPPEGQGEPNAGGEDQAASTGGG